MYDILLKNGIVADGMGGTPFKADVAVKNGLITAVSESISPDLAEKVLDVKGLCVSPGFIDIHSHSDLNFMKDNRCEAKLYQGVTTELSGQCGTSPFPRYDIKEYTAGSGEYSTLDDYIRDGEARGMSTNLLPLVGHGTLRRGVMGYEDRAPTADELSLMKKLLRKEMEKGAWGLSLGLGYTPGISADLTELCSLGEEVVPFDGIITSHMRRQNEHTPESLEEMYAISRHSGVHVHIAHFKASGKAAWGRAPEFMKNVLDAAASGINVTADVYPYTAASSGITNSFPKWSIHGGTSKTVELLKSSERGRLISELEAIYSTPEAAERLLIVETRGKLPEADGKTLRQAADIWGISYAEAAAKICVETDAHATCIDFCINEEDMLHILSQDFMSVGSDGNAFSLDPALNNGKPHPRSFGTFPRFLRLAREKGFCDLGTAVRRCTGLAADRLGIKNRGYIKEGLIADITVFDPLTVSDTNDYSNPFVKPRGIVHVIMDGRPAILDGMQTDLRLGKIIRKV